MPLVDYASSDEGEESEEGETVVTVVKPLSAASGPKSEISENGEKKASSNNGEESVFTTLPPQSRTNPLLLMDDNSLSNLLLNKKPGEKVKISVPSVTDFDDSETVKKKPKLDVKGSRLFSILPPPKNNFESSKAFVPKSVSSSQNKKYLTAKSSVINKYLKKPNESVEQTDNDDETDVGNSFFGTFLTESVERDKGNINSEIEESDPTMFPLVTSDVGVTENFQLIPPPVSDHLTSTSQQDDIVNSSFSMPDPQPAETADNPLGLDEKALQMLCGRKKNQQQIPMNIIDLSGEEIMPDSKEWLLKQLSEEKKVRSQSHRKSQGPSSQSRRKHQITYLAYQAKEQELELQNQWANNRMSRRQTQSKYGF